VSSPMANCAPFNAESESGARPRRGNSSSRHRPRPPREGARAGDASRETSAIGSSVRFGGQCDGVTLGASAPIGAAALTFRAERTKTSHAGNILR